MKTNQSGNFVKKFLKTLWAVVLVMLFMPATQAQFVSGERARIVAKNVYKECCTSEEKAQSSVSILNEKTHFVNEVPAFYIFNIQEGGFVLVSSDERIEPVLGYAHEGVFDINDLPCCLGWMIDQYSNQIYEVISDDPNNHNYEVNENWAKYENPDFHKSTQKMLAVSPLTTTTWSQGCYYNAMCPADPSLGTTRCGRCPTGCVATAFAQVLKYYNFPAQGVGSKSYTHDTYGTISANFAATTYNWASMPNKLLSDNQATATLLFHAGVSINMDYGPNGSSAYTTDVRKALVNTFKYASSTQYVYKTSYSDAQWTSLVKAELDAQRVVLINGYDEAAKAGHGFVCDGYDATNHFHINWGWNGSSDGYFLLTALSPSSYSFNSSVGAIIGITPSTTACACSGQQTLSATTGTVTDGSGSNNYANNLDCKWLIKPANVGSVTLTFTAFNTESNYDFVKVYNGETTSSPLLGSYSGTTLPPQLTASSGKMLIHFTSDNSTVKAGWSANYTGNAITTYCSGTTTLNAASGTVNDGSGSKNYSNNSDCYWQLSPPNAASVKLTFTSFNTESANDKLYVYNGTSTNDPLLGTFSGTALPSAVTASSGKMLLRFVTNASVTKSGWSAKYTSTVAFCSGTTTLTANSGTITDGSGSQYYDNNANCKWIIKPTGASSVKLTFTAFNTESGADFVKVYNGETTSSPLLGTFSGSTIPAAITANSGKMLVWFTSNASTKKPGFTANYIKLSKDVAGIEYEEAEEDIVNIFPNPNDGQFTLKFAELSETGSLSIIDYLGKIVYQRDIHKSDSENEISLSLNLVNGLYCLIIDTPQGRTSKKIIISKGK
ncbi:MAG TPA: C10 family peptidase [Bacteroidales bacterium]|nr:C10 family peptidase [Bacteroidales bacterium]